MPVSLPVALASSASGDQEFCVMVALGRLPPHQDRVQAGTAGSRLPHDSKGLCLSWGRNYPESGLVKPPRRDT
jgi:hypothetical protein